MRENHPKWRANATTAFLSFHKSEIGIPFPFKSNTFTKSNELEASSLCAGDSTPVHNHPLKQLLEIRMESDKGGLIFFTQKWRDNVYL